MLGHHTAEYLNTNRTVWVVKDWIIVISSEKGYGLLSYVCHVITFKFDCFYRSQV